MISVPALTMSAAINQALREEMRRDERVIVLGQDVGLFGGAFLVTRGLIEEFGPERVRDMPISEAAIIGCAVGAALLGWRPVAEMQYSDFVTCGFDQIANQAAKIHLMSGGQATVPMVLRLPIGAIEHGAQHDQSPEAWFVHTPGLKVVIPSTPSDARGLLKAAIRDDHPVVFCEHKALYGTKSVGGRAGDEPMIEPEDTAEMTDPDDAPIPLGLADVKRKGADVTVVATALMVHRALEAADQLAKVGISLEVIDPRTLVPLDLNTILASVEKTGRAVVVTEEARTGGAGAEISARISEDGFSLLDSPVARLGAADVPLPFSGPVQQALLPSVADIATACRRLVRR
ncbi:MAG: alpha-ketoacid dehydrogenase subunit beta [Candidatus Limnocylindrales bacterium]|jgi:pyruvate dehydrogenase E1 component beta subunit